MKERGGAGAGLLSYALYAHDGAPQAGGIAGPAVYLRANPVVTTTDQGVRRAHGAIPLNTWTHLATTYDGANMRFYVNGVLVGDQPPAPAASPSPTARCASAATTRSSRRVLPGAHRRSAHLQPRALGGRDHRGHDHADRAVDRNSNEWEAGHAACPACPLGSSGDGGVRAMLTRRELIRRGLWAPAILGAARGVFAQQETNDVVLNPSPAVVPFTRRLKIPRPHLPLNRPGATPLELAKAQSIVQQCTAEDRFKHPAAAPAISTKSS